MFRRFFAEGKSPTESADRLSGLASNDPRLLQAAREAPDPETRAAAVERIEDVPCLGDALNQDADPGVRKAAEQRLLALYQGDPGDGARRAQVLTALTGRSSLEHLFAVADPETAATILAHMTPDQWLRLALRGTEARLRKAAAQQISDPVHLQRLAEAARGRDKGVARIAKERLAEQRRASETDGHRQALCAEAEALATGPLGADGRARLASLEQAWRALEPAAEGDPLTQRFLAARDRLRADVAEAVASRRDLGTLAQEVDGFLAQLRGVAEADSLLVAEGQALITRLEDVATAPPPGLHALAAQVAAELGRVEGNRQRADALRAVLTWARDRHREEPLVPGLVPALDQRWERLPKPDAGELSQALERDYKQLRNTLQQASAKARAAQERRLDEIDQILHHLEKSIDAGELRQAITLRDRIRNQLARLDPARGSARAGRERRLNRLAKQVEEMKGWRHWGTVTAREELCTEMEALAAMPPEPHEAAALVRAARQKWQRIDQDEGPAGQDVWQRFDHACTQAYAPYQAIKKEEARERERHLHARQAIVTRVQDFLRDSDWNAPDWQEADRCLQQARRDWRKAGSVKPRDYKTLNDSFQEAVKKLDDHLQGERQRERQRREALIAGLKALAVRDDLDLGPAIAAAKSAQRQWQPRVRSARKVEQALWEAFRAVCDDIFARQAELRKDRESAAVQARREREAWCADLEGLVGDDLPAVTPEVLRQRLAETQRAWRAAAEVGGRVGEALEQRFRRAVWAVEARAAKGESREEQDRLRDLANAAERCAAVELAVLTGAEPQTQAAALAAWERYTRERGAPEPLERRVAAATAAPSNGATSMLADSATQVEATRALCLEMEILAGVPSPPEFQQARMAFQVAQLNRAMHGEAITTANAQDPEGALRELLRRWLESGPLPAAEREAQKGRLAPVWQRLAPDA